MTKKPKTFEEVLKLVDSGDIEVMLQEWMTDGTICFLICDHRRTYEDGEVYEVVV